MINLSHEKLIDESKRNLNIFLKEEKKSLITFTNDSKLVYLPKEDIDYFRLDVKAKTMYVPVSRFLDGYDEKEIIFHIFYELALYSDWRRNIDLYLSREKNFSNEIQHITTYILENIKEKGLINDPMYSKENIYKYVIKEVKVFLFDMDKYYSYLRVLQLNPMFRDMNLEKYMKSFGFKESVVEENPDFRVFGKLFLLKEIYGENLKTTIDLEDIMNLKIFNQELYEYVKINFQSQINNSKTIVERDNFIKTLIYSKFETLWKKEIKGYIFQKSKKIEASDDSKENKIKEKMNLDYEKIQWNIDDIEEVLKDIKEEDIELNNEYIQKDKYLEFEKFGISEDDYRIYSYYVFEVRKQRAEMQKFWRKIIGNAKKEENVKHSEEIKGKLDVPSLIKHYPDFVEGERKGNYKDLPIFSKYILKTKEKVLPEKIEISFVLDNSGSMNKEKIDGARKALAAVLLSIDDFNKYLRENTKKLNQKVEVLTEVWIFGSNFNRVKDMYYKDNKKEKTDIIKSIISIDGSYGATDDAACLKHISENIDYKKQRKLKSNKELKLLFEITDGASSFPGLAKKQLEDLEDKGVEVFAFQMGKTTENDRKLFNFVWNEDRNKKGIILGEDINNLTRELLKLVGSRLNKVFK